MLLFSSHTEICYIHIFVTPQIAWEGIYQQYQDECTGEIYHVRVGDDYTKGVVTGQSPRLSPGEHTAQATVTFAIHIP
ncbi:MAG: hypothetical protein ACOY4Q_09485 [Bacillota bacterium]